MSLEIGSFCTALIVTPEEVATAAYSRGAASQAPTSINNAADAQHTPRICYVSQKLPSPNEYLLHLVTSFDGSDITTQFFDHPERQNLFLAISPTPSHNSERALQTFPSTFSNPSYLCLDPGVVVRVRIIRACRTPVPRLSEAEDARLQGLIRRLQRSVSTTQPSVVPSDDSESSDQRNGGTRVDPVTSRISLWLNGCSNGDTASAANAGYTEAFHTQIERKDAGWTPADIAEGLLFLESYRSPAIPTIDVGIDFTKCRRDEVDPCGEFLKEAALFGVP